MSEILEVWAGSVIGREHVRLRRNNQDAAAFSVEPEAIVAVVADGCSSARGSEVGAKLAAEWVAANALRLRKKLPFAKPELFAEALMRALVRYLAGVVAELPRDAIADMFLFTLLVAMVERERTFVFGIGDGACAINGQLAVRCDRAPAYVAYRMIDPAEIDAEAPRATLHFVGSTAKLDSLLIATDGLLDLDAAELDALIRDPLYRVNATLLHKRLAAISERTKTVFDDTTVVLIRRVAEDER